MIYPKYEHGYNRNTLWLRDTVRQTSRGKSAAAGPTAGRSRPLTSLLCFEMRNTVIWWRTIFPYLYDVACQASWRHLSSEARGPKARPFVTMDCTWPIKKTEYEYGFILYLVIKKIASKSPIYIYRLTPGFRRHFAMFGDSSQVRACCSIVQMYGWNITQRAVSLCDVIMGSVTSPMHSHDKTNERTLSYRCANNAIERCQSSYRK